ncbi:RNA-directed DNA polymerase from mobile element jockey [Aphis craccivora]|uniref:RNA-directed DNA polymerase from mobile element jockey n=1 Tax=Aphis craccivora TaxID=307492 RepID=A0A6G0YH29_APHCR|nr:RNA-directed DNA polymerase from mobile element jockey [Aphis craccivora]
MEKIYYRLTLTNRHYTFTSSFQYKFIIHKCGTGMTNCSCEPIKMVLSFKYLGVTMDFNLKWSDIHNIKNKIRSLTVLFYKIRFFDKSIIR